jgi:surface antigen
MRPRTAQRIAPVALLAFLVASTGCGTMGQTMADNPKAATGAALGAAGGGLIGAAAGGGAAGIVGGVLLGGLLGGAIGGALDQRDKQLAYQAQQATLESSRTGQTSTWKNPDTGHYGSYTPTKTYESSSGQYCREYQEKVTIDGKSHSAYGTACRQPDGSWKIVN